ncbi:MAG: argininosuccinate lyase [Omnitrophica WOR_2 bacterium RIFCSPHIGHO2_02_FULL_68_15]|nr:MAG: argininosuccinate lyase [Omnitrophica WOR_2 bacterium RIFCSPHIGHO2_02_FULL_68_15]
MASKLWGGRFSKATDPLVERFTSSIGVDHRLARYDVAGSIAHAKMLGRCGIIPARTSRRIVAGLSRILRKIESGRWRPDPSAEDVHTQIQQQLERLIGKPARALHTARSRNDQAALDLRLYCRDAVAYLQGAIRGAQRSLVGMGRRYRAAVIPGYTHLQRAQPVLLAHHLLAYVEMLERDAERLDDARKRIEVLPLGSAALAGTTLPIDRRYVASLLGFPRVAANSMDAVSDRDFALELVSVLAALGVHLSRLAEDLILWATDEFGILELDDAYATGSSLMPQKKNPDVLELIRGQAGLVIGQLTAFLTVLKGLPLSYNRDLQWDKRCVFSAVDASLDALAVLAGLLRAARVRTDRLSGLLANDALCATDLAEYLVGRGAAFADAHLAVGRLVADAEQQDRMLRDFTLDELRTYSSRFGRDTLALLDPRRSPARKRSAGSTNPAQVNRSLARWHGRLKEKKRQG